MTREREKEQAAKEQHRGGRRDKKTEKLRVRETAGAQTPANRRYFDQKRREAISPLNGRRIHTYVSTNSLDYIEIIHHKHARLHRASGSLSHQMWY